MSYLKQKAIDIMTISKLIGHKDKTCTHLFQEQKKMTLRKQTRILKFFGQILDKIQLLFLPHFSFLKYFS
ncbi:hypothetical protein EI220_10645 [Streptococcus suis]|uniref:Uncharacterized protein n=1 Tax=Streptococcus suis TaxID=1307 RepID=A0A426G195_STRSU|nr:hypothetical protein EI220_10645 [Streptococcus suis]RRN49791.1 hypothetical protein EI219_06380 [Streptococcus suis]